MPTATWVEFARAAPSLAAAGERLLLHREQFPTWTAGLAYLATVRRDGGPRVHPISPALRDGRLYAFILRASPKHADLRRDPRFALHSFPTPLSPDFTDEEFYAEGQAAIVDDASLRRAVADLTHDDPASGDVFHLALSVAMHKTRAGGRPSYEKWRADPRI